MEEKRYQVFVSSTFVDLKDERANVIQTLMEMDCIPAGMELFPAADEEQLEFIKRVIDDCDYYIVIVGGRYGSTTRDGMSYTEKEYEYALERGLKVIALLHEDPTSLPVRKSEEDPAARQRLDAFRERLREGRVVRRWSSSSDLPGLVATSLSKTIKMFPAQGWVRASAESREQLLSEIAELRRRNAAQEEELRKLRSGPLVPGIAKLDAVIDLGDMSEDCPPTGAFDLAHPTTWRQLFSSLGPFLMEGADEYDVQRFLAEKVLRPVFVGKFPILDDSSFLKVKIQLKALGLVEVEYLDSITDKRWSLTPQGKSLMYELNIQRA